jgi:hypothetical protein
MDNEKALEEMWEQCFRNPNQGVDIGRIVACDICGRDWTDSPVSGGMIFLSKGICPACFPGFNRSVHHYNEQHFIRGLCRPDQSFADFIREYRGPHGNVITFVNPGAP